MTQRIMTWLLSLGVAGSIVLLAPKLGNLRTVGNDRGYEPDQPLAFSHRLHAGELGIGCLYCHFGAEKSRYAGIPATSTCFQCHRFVTAPWGAVRAEETRATKEGRKPRPVVSPELAKLYRHLGLGTDGKPDPGLKPAPIAWVRVHRLPDFVYFDHRPHVLAGVACQVCHGPVESMERLRQWSDLSMGWCVNCHRNAQAYTQKPVQARTDCSVCHF